MADVEKIIPSGPGKDTLRTGVVKFNKAIDSVNTFQKQVDQIVVKGDSSVEAAQARVNASGAVYPTLQARLNEADGRIDDAQAKASNPLAALSTAGYKIPLSDLSDEVKIAMTGTTGITTAKGYYENNRGVEYPLKNLTRDGTLYTVSNTVKDAILDARVINATPGKLYSISYIAKGFNGSYGFSVEEYDEATFASNSAGSRRLVASYVNFPFTDPANGIVTRVIEVEGKVFIVTIDYSKITSTGINITQSTTGLAYGTTIDKGNYVYKTAYNIGLGYLENNRGVDYPLRSVVRDGVKSPISQEVKDVILDAKVINAEQGKYYTIAYIANGYSDSYGFTIRQYDKATFSTDSLSSESQLITYVQEKYSVPLENPVTRVVNVGDLIFVITLDYSKIKMNFLNINSIKSGIEHGWSAIIDENNYIFKKKRTIEVGKDRYSFPLVAYKSGTTLGIKFEYSDVQNMIVEFDLLGINQITHLKRIFLQDKVGGTHDLDMFSNRTLLNEVLSDWISPYRLTALNNTINNPRLFTTGANHGTDNGEGLPTARNGGARIFVDDMELRDGETAFAREKVVIETIQYVSCWNAINLSTGAKRDSLKETIKYTITPGNIAVSHNQEALEDLMNKDYGGLQSTKGAWGDKIYFMDDPAAPIVYDISGTNTAQSSLKANGLPERWVTKKGGNVLVAYFDKEIGLGNRQYVNDTESPLYTTGTKIYGRLIWNGNGVMMRAGESFYWVGGYTFTKGLNCPGAETAYKIRNHGGKKVYVVDFNNAATSTYLQVDPTDFNKKITVIEKSSSITVDNYISAKGLKISASGYGQLKFTVN
ncbi:hypothetical protein D1B31_16315 [Neobacillus notoginsengisoli]|uniref:Uncharacterized protein n=1 Tax=Neobacillus notoginsengisoli TaxID=1578198 RepID=A0A417YRI1_9BACI|nr:hypothetical protein [Neobacillus notoginsengisoli]RHW37327.1 hypothetical protein D1B31_16315 [Neobacillus notoginsengisoli]